MALTVEQLKVVIEGETKGLNNQLTQINNKLGLFGDTANKVSNSVGNNLFGSMVQANIIGTVVTNTIGKLTNSMGSFINETIAGGSALARLRVANQVVTANMGMTSEAVQQLRADLAEANTMGIAAEQVISSLALSGLVEMAKQLEYVDGRTGETTKGVTALTLAIKDLSAARGMDSVTGIERVSKFIQRGEASLADGLIEIGEINREYSEFAVRVGKTTDTLSQQERAQVRLNIVMREGAKSFGAYAATYNTSGKIFSSVGMLIRSIAQEIGSHLEPILRVGSLAFLEFFRGIQSSVFGASGAIENFANRVAGYMVALIRIIGRLGSSLPLVGAGFKRLAEFTLQPIKANGALQNSLGGTSDAMNQTGKDAKKLEKDLMGLAGFDELNVLKEADSGSAGAGATPVAGGGGGVGGGLDAGGFADTTQEIMKYASEAEGVFKKMGDAVNSILEPLNKITIFGKPLPELLGDIAKYAGIALLAFKILSPIVGLLVAGFGALTSPITLTVLAIAGLVAVFKLAYDNSADFRKFVDELAVAIKDGLVVAFNLLSEAVTWAWQNVIQPAVLWFQENILPVLTEIGLKIQEMVAIFVEKLPEIQAAIAPLVESVGNFLAGAFRLLGTIIDWLWKNILKPLVDFILANIVPAFQFVINIVTEVIKIFVAVATPIIDTLIPVLTMLWDTFTQVFDAIKGIVEGVWNNVLKPIFTALYDFISKFIIPVFQLVWRVGEQVWNGIRQTVENVWAGIMNAIRPAIEWINTNIMPVVQRVADGIGNAFNGVKTTLEGVWNGITGTLRSTLNWIIDKINGFIRGVNNMIAGLDSVSSIVGINVDFRVGEIPRLAAGGVINSPTIAMMGEQGYKEAVVPLERNTGWAQDVADLLNNASGGGQAGQTVIVQLGDEKIFEKFIDFVNDKSTATGMTVLNV